MKQMTCEMCGSTDLMKQDGVFVCQSCGMKYSVEDAKRMMIEGVVDVQGTVKVDNSAFVEKYLANARRAKQKEDWDEVEKYYNMVEQNDPTNIEAIFYSSYGKAKSSLVDSDIYKRQAAFKVLQNCVSIVDDNFDINKEESQKEILLQIAEDICDMACSSYVFNQRTNEYGSVTWTDKSQTESLFIHLIDEMIETASNIAVKYNTLEPERKIYLYELMIELHEFQIKHMGLTREARNIRKNMIVDIHEKIHQIDPTHIVPEKTTTPERSFSFSSGEAKPIWFYLLVIGMGALLFGSFMFMTLGESRYFIDYLLLSGYYSALNVVFALDYILIFVGAAGTLVTVKAEGKKVSIAAILGIAGFVFAWLVAIVGHALSIAGIVFGLKEKKDSNETTGFKISVIAECAAVMSSIIGIILM